MKRPINEIIEDINIIVNKSIELTEQAQSITDKAIILKGDLKDFFDLKCPPYDKHKVKCPNCGGRGEVMLDGVTLDMCDKCNGAGEVEG